MNRNDLIKTLRGFQGSWCFRSLSFLRHLNRIGKWLVVVLVLIGLDMGIGGSVYHPLIYPYKLGNFILCRNHSQNWCSDLPPSMVTSRLGLVVSEHHEATQVGIDILRQGGNAVDAAVAIGYALAVVDPCCGNIGGGGFMLIHAPSTVPTVINFREKAPMSASSNMFQDPKGNVVPDRSKNGYLAVAVPGTVAGLDFAQLKYGTQSRQQVMAGSISLAEQGFVLNQFDIDKLKPQTARFRSNPVVASIFLNQDRSYAVGERLVQAQLAQTLKKISQQGEEVFYRGEIARQLVQSSDIGGGVLSLQDLADYSVVETPPLVCRYKQHQILTTPLPGGGVTLCQMLGLLELDQVDQTKVTPLEQLHQLLMAMLVAYADRNRYLGDLVHDRDPTTWLLSSVHLGQMNQFRQSDRAVDPAKVLKFDTAPKGTHTSHYSVVDRDGMVVAVTYTLNSQFGSHVIAGDTGFFLNNEMDDFTAKLGQPNQFGLIQGSMNQIEPGKRPLSSIAPTIVLDGKQPWLVTGSPGGSTIPTTILQIILRMVNKDDSLNYAVTATKVHYQGYPNLVLTEPAGLSSQMFLALWQKGYRVIPFPRWGAAESIVIDPKTFVRYGINDIRRPGGLAMGQ